MPEKKLRIGMTECGFDPGINMAWRKQLAAADGAILITKHVTDEFIKSVIEDDKKIPIIVHATTTGWGGTKVEPNVPVYETQLSQLKKLIDSGFPIEKTVLRIDPIIPTAKGFDLVQSILNRSLELGLLPKMRVRISVMDNYPHVIKRFKDNHINPLYDGKWSAPDEKFETLKTILKPYGDKGITFETCAEPKLKGTNYIKAIGCLSNTDLKLMGLPSYTKSGKNQQRKDCLCLPLKFQLIKNFTPCSHKCLYCYWKDK